MKVKSDAGSIARFLEYKAGCYVSAMAVAIDEINCWLASRRNVFLCTLSVTLFCVCEYL